MSRHCYAALRRHGWLHSHSCGIKCRKSLFPLPRPAVCMIETLESSGARLGKPRTTRRRFDIFYVRARNICERIYEFRPHPTFIVRAFMRNPLAFSLSLSLSLSRSRSRSRRCPRRINVGRGKIATYGIIVRAIGNNTKRVHEA